MNTPSKETLFLLAVQSGIPVILKGAPGEAKTSYIAALAKASNRHLEVVIASTREPADFGGFPCLDNGVLRYVPPAWAQRLVDAKKNGKGGILFFDEISCAAPMCQNALLRVILERVVGETELPPDLWVVAAMNPPEQTASGWDLAAPMSNRFYHLNWEVNTEAWIGGMLTDFKAPEVETLPENWRESIPQSRSLIASYIHARPSNLRRFPEEESKRSGPWASPRSWDMASRISAAFQAAGYDDRAALSAVIGEDQANEFCNYRKQLDLPNPETLLANPTKFVFPASSDVTFAILTAVTAAVLNKNTPERYAAAWKLLKVAVDAKRADLAAHSARVLAMNRPANSKTMPNEIREFLPMLQNAKIRLQ